jgi:RHS repeat-associated protein
VAVLIVAVLGLESGACGGGAENESESVETKASRLTGVALVTIDPKGYKGGICVGSLGCTPTTGLARSYDLAAGVYTLTATFTQGLDADNTTVGTLTVPSSGPVTLDAAVGLKSFNAPIIAGTNVTINAKVVPVLLNKKGFPGAVGPYGGGAFDNVPNPLLFGRRYRMLSMQSTGLIRDDFYFSPDHDLRVSETGSIAFIGPEITQSFEEPDGGNLTLKVTDVTLDRNNFIGTVGVAGLGGFVSGKFSFINGRRYRLTSSYSLHETRPDIHISSSNDLEISPAGVVRFIEGDEGDAGRRFFPIANNTLKIRTVPLSIDRDGSLTALGLAGLGGPDSTSTVYLMVGRKYRLQSSQSIPAARTDINLAPDWDLLVNLNGVASIIHDESLDSVFQIANATLKIRTATLNLNRDNYLGTIGIAGLGGFDPQNKVKLMRGRRYRLVSSYSLDDLRDDANLAPDWDLAIDSAGVASIIHNDTLENVFPISGNELKIRTATISLDRNNYIGTLSILQLGGFDAQGNVKLMRGRRYRLVSYYSLDDVRDDSYLSGGHDIRVDPDGNLQPTINNIDRTIAFVGNTLELKTTTIALESRGYPGNIGITQIGSFVNGTAVLLNSRRYRLNTTWAYHRQRVTDSGFHTSFDFALSTAGEVSILSSEAAISFEKTGPTSLALVTVPLRINANGYTGPISLHGIGVPDTIGNLTLVKNRLYRLIAGAGSFDLIASHGYFNATATPDLAVDENGRWVQGALGGQFTFDPDFRVITPRLGTLQITRPAGYTGSLGIAGVNVVASAPSVSIPVIIGRRYPIFPGNGLVTFPLASTQCTPNPYVSGGFSFPINCSDSIPPAAPPPPMSITVGALSGSKLQATWTDTSGGTAGVVIRRSAVAGPSYVWTEIAALPAGTTNYTDEGRQPSTTYYYQIASVNTAFPTPAPGAWAPVPPASGTTLAACVGETTDVLCNEDRCNPMYCVAASPGGPRTCQSGTPVTCPARNQCYNPGTCNPETGACVDQPKMVGTLCSDANYCVNGDSCGDDGLGGRQCVPGTSEVTCGGNNSCTTGTCEPATGACTIVAAEGAGPTCGLSALSGCVMSDPTGLPIAVFGYVNNGGRTIQSGAFTNTLTPASLAGNEPKWFLSGSHPAAFAVPTGGQTVTWQLGAQTISASGDCSVEQSDAAKSSLLIDSTLLTNAIQPTADLGGGQTIGNTTGSLSVTNRGTASYGIALDTPEGRKGVEPNLSLSYDSAGGKSGLLGVGWSLGGLSSIHRCPRTIATDGYVASVKYDATDAFCWDGQRLVPVDTSGSQREYKTQRATHTRIVGFAHGPSGPAYFEVQTANGHRLTYGKDLPGAFRATITPVPSTADPEEPTYPPPSSTGDQIPVDWPIVKEIDPFGNTMTVSYDTQNYAAGVGGAPHDYAFSRKPLSIDYTGHEPSNTEPLRSVQFIYDTVDSGAVIGRSELTDSDPYVESYQAGIKFAVSNILTAIEMWAPNPRTPDKVRAYKLRYDTSAATRRALLMGVKECDAGGICKPETQFAYTPTVDDEPAYSPSARYAPGVVTLSALDFDATPTELQTKPRTLLTGDLNGDGRDDLVFAIPTYSGTTTTERVRYALSTGTNFGTPSDIEVLVRYKNLTGTNPLPNARLASLIDIDGDGVSELLFATQNNAAAPVATVHCKFDTPPSGGAIHTCFVDGGDRDKESTDLPPPGSGFYRYADLDGDGFGEVVASREKAGVHGLYYRKNTEGVLGDYQPLSTIPETPSTGFLNALDVDGDGKDEMFVWASANDQKASLLTWTAGGVTQSQTNAPYSQAGAASPSVLGRWTIDTNGDGLPDLVTVEVVTISPITWTLKVRRNTGAGFLPPETLMLTSGNNPNFPYFSNGLPHRSDDGVRIVDWDNNGTQDMVLVHDGRGASSAIARANIYVLRFMPNGDVIPFDTGVPVGSHTNGWSGAYWPPESCGPIHCDRTVIDPVQIQMCNYRSLHPCLFDDPELYSDPFSFLMSRTLDVNGDGLVDIINYDATSGRFMLHVHGGSKPDMLRSIIKSEGAGAATVAYSSIRDGGIYSGPCSSATPPPPPLLGDPPPKYGEPDPMGGFRLPDLYKDFFCLRSREWAVSEIKRDNGRSSAEWLKTDYSYRDGRISRTGHGFLGFDTRIEKTSRGGVQTTTTSKYRSFELKGLNPGSVYPFQGMRQSVVTEVERIGGNEPLVHRTTETVSAPPFSAGGGAYEWTAPDITVKREEIRNGYTTLLSQIGTHPVAFTYGRPESIQRTVTDGQGRTHVDTTTYTYVGDDLSPGGWRIGPVKDATSTSVSAGVNGATRKIEYKYYPLTLALESVTRQPEGSDDVKQTTAFVVDSRGLVTRIERRRAGETRVETYAYDELEHFYRVRSTNALNMTSVAVFHPAIDQVVATRDVNGLVTKYIYDGFGRLKMRDNPTGLGDVTVTLARNPTQVVSQVVGTTGPASYSAVVYDRLGRVATTRSRFDEGRNAITGVEYDEVGRIVKRYHPAAALGLAPYTTYTYDELGRVKTVSEPNDSGVLITRRTNTYVGNVTTSCDALSNCSDAVTDERGLVVKSIDHFVDGSTSAAKEAITEYDYGPYGLLDQIRAKKSESADPTIVTDFIYDEAGRRTNTNDSNRGASRVVYNGFDEVVQSYDAEGHLKLTLHYDLLGRMDSRISPDGTSTWTYDTAAYGLGALGSTIGEDGVEDINSYDHLSRLSARVTKVVGQSYEFKYAYDPVFGRVEKVSYPLTPGWDRFEVTNEYRSGTSELSKVKRADNGFVLWEATSYHDSGRLMSETFGGVVSTAATYHPVTGELRGIDSHRLGTNTEIDSLSYTYDLDGNLARRGNSVTGEYQGFTHDGLDRLTEWYPTDAAGSPQRSVWEVKYGYDELGHMKSRNITGTDRTAQTATFSYGANGVGPSAMTSWNFQGGGKASTGDQSFTYDAEGRMKTHPRLGTITYNAFNLPTNMTGGTVTADFLYDSGGRRAYKKEGTDITIYVGAYESRIANDGTIQHVLGLPMGVRGGGQVVRERRNTGVLQERTSFYLRDHLGSVTAIVGADGVETSRKRTDPFGNTIKQADVAYPALDPESLVASVGVNEVHEGFAGHEQDDRLGVINMGGRIYEPLAGRFLTTDPFAAGPKASQAWNPYAYVANRPVGFVDPSGYLAEDVKVSRPAYPQANKPPTCGYVGCPGEGQGRGWGGRSSPVPLPQDSTGHWTSGGGDDSMPIASDYAISDAAGDELDAFVNQVADEQDALVEAGRAAGMSEDEIDAAIMSGTLESAVGKKVAEKNANEAKKAAQKEKGEEAQPSGGEGENILDRTAKEGLALGPVAIPIAICVGGGCEAFLAALGIGTGVILVGVAVEMSDADPLFNTGDERASTLQPGPHAGESIPARGPQRDFTSGERAEVNDIGKATGCHTCGTKNPGTKGRNFVPDHQPPSGLNPTGGPQQLYPHCLTCSRAQGGEVRWAGPPWK